MVGDATCWACSADLSGPMRWALQLDERWKGKLGSGIHVALCSECAVRVRRLLYTIQDESDVRLAAERQEQGGEPR